VCVGRADLLGVDRMESEWVTLVPVVDPVWDTPVRNDNRMGDTGRNRKETWVADRINAGGDWNWADIRDFQCDSRLLT
jgi:hypothetical protein